MTGWFIKILICVLTCALFFTLNPDVSLKILNFLSSEIFALPSKSCHEPTLTSNLHKNLNSLKSLCKVSYRWTGEREYPLKITRGEKEGCSQLWEKSTKLWGRWHWIGYLVGQSPSTGTIYLTQTCHASPLSSNYPTEPIRQKASMGRHRFQWKLELTLGSTEHFPGTLWS